MSSLIQNEAAAEMIGRAQTADEIRAVDTKPQAQHSNYPPKPRFADTTLPHSHRAMSA